MAGYGGLLGMAQQQPSISGGYGGLLGAQSGMSQMPHRHAGFYNGLPQQGQGAAIHPVLHQAIQNYDQAHQGLGSALQQYGPPGVTPLHFAQSHPSEMGGLGGLMGGSQQPYTGTPSQGMGGALGAMAGQQPYNPGAGQQSAQAGPGALTSSNPSQSPAASSPFGYMGTSR
jgi:hypothetical protein